VNALRGVFCKRLTVSCPYLETWRRQERVFDLLRKDMGSINPHWHSLLWDFGPALANCEFNYLVAWSGWIKPVFRKDKGYVAKS